MAEKKPKSSKLQLVVMGVALVAAVLAQFGVTINPEMQEVMDEVVEIGNVEYLPVSGECTPSDLDQIRADIDKLQADFELFNPPLIPPL